jgi:hypothetical protein
MPLAVDGECSAPDFQKSETLHVLTARRFARRPKRPDTSSHASNVWRVVVSDSMGDEGISSFLLMVLQASSRITNGTSDLFQS